MAWAYRSLGVCLGDSSLAAVPEQFHAAIACSLAQGLQQLHLQRLLGASHASGIEPLFVLMSLI